MKFFVTYIKKKRTPLLLFIAFFAVFLATFALYEISLAAVLYPAAVCSVIGIAYLIIDFKKAKAKHERLSEIATLSSSLMNDFPSISTIDDEDYMTIISALREEQANILTSSERSYRNMTDYYTVWAHQIKTPIASMRLSLQNEDSALSRQVSDDLQRIEQYVEMVLAFLRLDSPTTDYVFKSQSLDPIIKESVKKFAGQFIRKKITLNYEALDMTVVTDEKWLTFVIEQVLSNAVKYTSSGSITIKKENDSVISIKDTGIGIAPEDLPRVFEKSYTGYNGRYNKKASGIGLYLCKRVCDSLGHRITAESDLDEGTTIKIDLAQRKRDFE